MDIVQDLVKILARALFDPTHVMLVEIIVHNPASTTEQLAQALQMTTKQVQKICGALKVAGLVHTETRWEDFVPEHDVVREKRRVARSFFYVDYRQVVNMAKFKLYRLGRKIQQQTEALVQLPYRCPRCDRAYSALESLTLDRTADLVFLCECCSVELVLDSNDDVHDDTDRYLHFMNQTRPILELLKQADSVTIPDSKPKLLMDNVAKEPQIPNAVLVPKDAEVVVELQEATKAAVDTDSKLAEYYATLKDDNVKEELIDSDDEEFVEG